jgi:hypothetical protein
MALAIRANLFDSRRNTLVTKDKIKINIILCDKIKASRLFYVTKADNHIWGRGRGAKYSLTLFLSVLCFILGSLNFPDNAWTFDSTYCTNILYTIHAVF